MKPPRHSIRVYMMDLLATVPYYTAYLSHALLQQGGVDVQVGSITYYLDPGCFRSRGLSLDPGCIDVVGRFARLPRMVRRPAKLAETLLNLLVLLARFLTTPPEVLHVQFLPMLRSQWPLDYWFVRVVQRRGVRVVLTVHDLMPHDTADQFRDKFLRLYRTADQLICHSGNIQARLQNEFDVEAERINVIPHGPFFYDLPPERERGLELRRQYGISAEQALVLWQGIIFPYKGLDLLLDAWAAVEAAFPSATLVIVGTGSTEMLDQIRAQVSHDSLKRVVLDLRFTSTEELVALYREATVVVYPYRAITTSGALATGVAFGKAIVATDLPVFRELLKSGEDALLVPPLDTVALGDAILRVLREPLLRDQMECSLRSKDFGDASWLAIASKTVVVYEKALNRK